MKIKELLYFSILLLGSLFGKAQVMEDFSDGNFSVNPDWTGNTGDWTVNAAFQLQSNNMVAGSSYYLSTASTSATSAQWEMYVRLSFNTSSANYADIFLTASASDLSAPTTIGYFVRIGNTDDEISLYRKESSGAVTKIIDGANGITATTNNTLRIKVIRDAASKWTLYRDISGTANAYVPEGSATDATFTSSSFFGILVKQSTAGFFQRHFFDDINIKPYTPDTAPPLIQSVTPLSANTLDVLFNEPVENASGRQTANYVADISLGSPATAELDNMNTALVHLTFAGSFTSATNYRLTVNGVQDLAGNRIVNATANFIYFAPYIPRLYDVVIDEIMADPTPQVGLPNNEWVELRNTAASPINLQGWRIGDATGQSNALPNFILLPDSFVIICNTTSMAALEVFGNTIGIPGFPSLGNTDGQLFLKSSGNSIIHSVNYKDNWYRDDLKKNGGWTLEMIDTKNPCSGSTNWKAGSDNRGGTPGNKNSVDAVNADDQAPRLLRAYTTDSLNIVLVFDEPLDSLKTAVPANFNISDGIAVTAVQVPVLSPGRVILNLNTPLIRSKVYTVTVTAVTDCLGNVIGNKNAAKTGLSEVATLSDIVINEILFDPPPGGSDYVEIYNRSNKIIDLAQTYIASRNSSGAVSSNARLSAESILLFPQDFVVVTESAAIVKAAYVVQNIDAFAEINSLPSFNNDKGTVILLNEQGVIVDELAYNENWHFKLIDNREGVALERIDYNAPTQLPENWHSAATSAGYGTPTYKNSQYRVNDGVQGEIKLLPEIVSPDNDGQDDIASIEYSFPQPGYVANITVFNASGRAVRFLQKNALCGTKGSFRWDGFGEKGLRLATGVYIVFTEVFNLKGNRKQFKNAIVLARRN